MTVEKLQIFHFHNSICKGKQKIISALTSCAACCDLHRAIRDDRQSGCIQCLNTNKIENFPDYSSFFPEREVFPLERLEEYIYSSNPLFLL